MKPQNVVLGPCPCRSCGMPVWWSYGSSWSRDNERHTGLLWWRGADGRAHACSTKPRHYRTARQRVTMGDGRIFEKVGDRWEPLAP